MLRVHTTPLRLLLSLGMVLGLSATATLAAWVDPVAVSGTTLRTATVDLQVQNANALANYSGLSSSTLAAGESTAGVLTVRNNGTVPLSYFVDAAASNPDGKGLAAALVVKVTNNSATSGSFPYVTCANSALADTASSFTSGFVGSPTSPRTLSAGASETLCVQTSLPTSTPTTMQSATTAVSFTFTAATVPATAWADSVPVGGTTYGTVTITTPVLNCGAQIALQSVVNWQNLSGVTAYRIHHGTDSSVVEDLPGNQNSYPFKAPASGTAYLEALYGPVWMSGASNTRTYSADGTTSTCS